MFRGIGLGLPSRLRGTGLGLAIADRVVQLHGGTITARNRLPLGFEVDIRMLQAQHF